MSYLTKQASLSLAAERLKRIAASKEQGNLRRYQTNPHAYAKEVLGIRWTKQQQKISRALLEHNRVLVHAAHGVGKTHVVGGLVNWFYDVFPRSITITTAPTYPQVEKLLWGEIRAQRTLLPSAGVVQIKDPSDPLHYALGRSPSKRAGRDEMGSQAFQGTHAENLLIVFDEGAGVSADRWKVVDGLIVGRNNKFLVIGNPVVTSGPYFDAARNPRWHVIEISALDHPNIAAGLEGKRDVIPGAVSLPWIEDKLENNEYCEYLGEPEDSDQRATWLLDGAFEFPPEGDVWYSPTAYGEARMLGRFPSKGIDTVWQRGWLDAAEGANMRWVPGEPWEIGVDVARFGDDSTVVHSRRGPVSVTHDSWRKMDTMETVRRIIGILSNQPIIFQGDLPTRIILRIDTTGGDVGVGVADRIKQLLEPFGNVQLQLIGAKERPFDQRKYQNKRSEIWFTAASWAQSGTMDLSRIPEQKRDVLIPQLMTTTFIYDAPGRRVVEKKKDIKERIGRSPDDADAFNLAYYVRGREYRAVDYSAENFHKSAIWDGPSGQVAWANVNESHGSGRSWVVGRSTRRRFSK